MSSRFFPRISNALLPVTGVAMVVGIYLVLSDASPTWLILAMLGVSFVSAMFWWRDPKELLFMGFMLTISIDISKALIAEGGVYTPGLSLFLSDLFLIGFLAFRIFERYLVTGRRWYFGPPLAIALGFTAYMWISGFMSNNVLAGVLAAVSHTKYLLTALVIADYVDSPRRLRLVLGTLAAGMGLQVMMMAAQVVTGSDLAIQGTKNTTLGTTLVFEAEGGLNAFRPTGFLNHPNVAADYLVFLLPVLFGFVLLGKRQIGVAWHVCVTLFLAGTAALVLTLSRAGWISFLVAILFFLAVGMKKRVTTRRHMVTFASLLLAIALAVAVLYPAAYLRIIGSDQRSSESRWLLMDQAMLIISRYPVFGVGLGGYNGAAQENIPESFSYVSKAFQDDLLKGVVHNKYLLITAEHGVLGLLLFLAIFWSLMRRYFRFRQWTSPTYITLGIGIMSGIVAQLVFYLFDNFYTDLRIQLLWTFIGLLLALFRIEESNTKLRLETQDFQPSHAASGAKAVTKFTTASLP